MSGTAEAVRPPKTDAEWARDTSRRIEQVENATSVRVGPWVLSTSPDGHLIASNVEGGSTILAQKPEGVENDPDAVVDATVNPAVCVTLAGSQTLPAAGATVVFDGTRLQVGGDWTGGRANFDSIIVPVSGVYKVTATLNFRDGGGWMSTIIMVDDIGRLIGRATEDSGTATVWVTSTATGLLQLSAGQKISVFAKAFLNQVIGSSPLTSSTIPSELSLTMTQRGS